MTVRSPIKLPGIYAAIRGKIADGTFGEGDLLPTTRELSETLECSVGMASKAIAMLIHEGLVEQRRGLGTRVLKTIGKDAVAQLDAVAFIYPSDQHEGMWAMAQGFQKAARDEGRRVVMLSTGANYRREAEFIGRLSEYDVRGAVIFPAIVSPQEQIHLSQLILNSKFPIVLAELNLPGLGCPSVCVDGFHAGHVMTCHMVKRGARKIGFFSNYSWAPFMRDRYQGYRRALLEAGLEEPNKGVLLDPSLRPDFNDPLAEPTRMAEAFLADVGDIEAIVCADDYLALGCMAAAAKAGIKVPDDLLVCGIDDYSSLASSSKISLTTYRAPCELMGQRAFDLIQETLGKKQASCAEHLFRGEIVIRESA